MTNKLLISELSKMEELNTTKGDTFRARAYRNAVQTIRNLSYNITSGEKALELPGIGKSIATKIDEILKKGTLKAVKEYDRNPIIKSKRELLMVSGLGPSKVKDLMSKKITSVKKLRKAVKDGKVTLPSHALIGLKHYEDFLERIPRRN